MRAEVQVATDGNGNGYADFPQPWDHYRGVSGVGFDPPFVGGYKNPVVTAHQINGNIRIVVTGWIPNSKATTYVNLASV